MILLTAQFEEIDMTIKSQGGIFGRNPTFNNVEVESLTIAGNAVPDASTILVDGDIGSTVQAYDADTAKLDVAQTFSAFQTISTASDGIHLNVYSSKDSGFNSPLVFLRSDQNTSNDSFRPIAYYNGGAGAYRFYVTDAGNIHTAGNLVVDSGNGIDFSATAGTGTSELFDDYEEGTWTPAYSTSGGSFGYDSATQGQYTKIGNVVTVYFRIYTNSATVGTGDVSITGLPFAEAIPSGLGGGSIGDCRLFAGDTPDTLTVAGSAIYPYYRTSANGANTPLQASDLDTGGAVKNLIDGQITYITS
jgi:hypothetical protein